MDTLFLFLQDVILAAIAYFLYIGVFTPIMKKNALYAKLKAKEKAELDQRLGLQEYFAVKTDDSKK